MPNIRYDMSLNFITLVIIVSHKMDAYTNYILMIVRTKAAVSNC